MLYLDDSWRMQLRNRVVREIGAFYAASTGLQRTGDYKGLSAVSDVPMALFCGGRCADYVICVIMCRALGAAVLDSMGDVDIGAVSLDFRCLWQRTAISGAVKLA